MPIATWPAAIYYEFGFNAPAGQGSIPPFWTNLSSRILWAWKVQRGRYYELDSNPTGTWNFALANADGALDPDNPASPYAGNLVPYRCCRIRSLTGVNLLTVDQATAGEASGLLGAVPARLHVVNDQGYPLSIVTSGSAFQGSQVYQATLTSGATAGASILLVQQVPVIPGRWYSFQAQARITSGNTATTNTTVTWWDQDGGSLGATTGAGVSLASGSGTWVQVPVSGQAPTTCYSATLKIEIAAGTLAASTTWQIDALQWENSATPTPWQAPQSLSANLLPQAIATGTQSIDPTSDAVTDYFTVAGATGNTITQAAFLSGVPSGQTVALAWTSPAGTSSSTTLYAGNWLGQNNNGPQPDNVQVTAGTTYTASVYLSRAASGDSAVQVQLSTAWFNATSATAVSTTHGGAVAVTPGSWVRATATGTAPAGVTWARVHLQITSPATTTAQNVIYATGWQMEAASSVSAWTDPGPTYQVFNGSVERWPQSWELSGTYGKIDAVGVDNFALLSQDVIPSPFVAEVLAMNPDFFYQLNDPAGATSCADTSGKRVAAPVENSPYGAGSVTFGSSITSTTAGDAFIGTSGPVATFNNNPTQNAMQQPETFVSLHKTTTTPGPPSGPWTRHICFRTSTVPSGGSTFPTLWAALTPSYISDASYYQLNLNPTTGTLSFQESAVNGLGPLWTSGASVCDGNWHQVVLIWEGDGFFDVYFDGTRVFHDDNGGLGWSNMTNISTDVVGAFVVYGHNAYVLGWVGDLAHVIQFPFALTQSQVTNLYNSWRTASTGDSSGQRAQRVLTWSGYSGPAAIETGATTNMGPATDIAGSTAIDTSTALLPGGVAFTGGSGVQALNTIAQTENGNVYCASDGPITFTARTDRYNRTVPMFIFGERDYLGEWPYELVKTDFDPAHLYTGVQVTQYSSGQVAPARSATAAFQYGQRVQQLTMNQGSWTETQDAADYLLGRYASVSSRIPAIQLHPSAMPGLFAVCLQLEIGTRIRVMRRPPNAPARAYELFIESIAWSVDPTSGKALVTLQCSPADLTAYWTLGSLHTTLGAQAASGQNQATINALPDAAVNALASSLSQNTGYQLVFDPGTAIQETMTLATGGIPATSIGYTSATLTFTSNFAHTHAAGATVCEVLPTGVSDPTTYDMSSILGATATTLNASAAAGANTITISALPDAKLNPAGSDWTTGDLIWIGVGTPDFEGYNLLTPAQSTAGEDVFGLPAGTAGTVVGVSGFYSTPVVTASATAWQGANVWQAPIGASVATGHTLIKLAMVAVTPGLPFTFSAYVRSATTSANPQVNPQIGWIGGSTVTGTAATLTGSPTASWTRVTVTATAPAGAVWALVGVNLAAAAPGSAWSFQADGMQFEQAGSASTYQTCPQIQSVATTVAGYSTAVITLAQNLANSHAAGETVSDPLPPGATSPAAYTGTARVAY